MSKPKNWSMIYNNRKKVEQEFKNFFGEPIQNFTINEEGIQDYKCIQEICNNVNLEILYGSMEYEYRQRLAERLREKNFEVKEECTYRQEISGIQYRPRADLEIKNENGEFVVEIKLARRINNFFQLAEYLVAANLPIGYLICFLKNKVEVFMLLRIHDNDKLYCYHSSGFYMLPLEFQYSQNNHTIEGELRNI
jgi:GxxExxY protein